MGNKHMKKCSTSLAIKEMQIKIVMRFYPIPVRMVIIRRHTTSAGENKGERGSGGGEWERGAGGGEAALIYC
jgi:hypothetical protein